MLPPSLRILSSKFYRSTIVVFAHKNRSSHSTLQTQHQVEQEAETILFERNMSSPKLSSPLDIRDMRKSSYRNSEKPYLLENELPSMDPYVFFDVWFKEIARNTEILYAEANACALATADKTGRPSVRMVLLKGYNSEGFQFYTNYHSRKGSELEQNNQASMLFYWARPNRSIRVEGRVHKLSAGEADDYWKRRPYDSQASSAISDQSTVVPGRQYLEGRIDEMKEKHMGGTVPRPDHWGGYNLVPESFEFWQGQTDRLHDRIKFRRRAKDEQGLGPCTVEAENGWLLERLAP